MSIIPAIIVAKKSPSKPCFNIMPATIVANAAVGPVMFTLLPPKSEVIKPAIIAVKSPLSGVAPEAIASAMERGNAIIATITPATTSAIISFPL